VGKNRRAQVTIFIIIAILIVGGIILFFALKGFGVKSIPTELEPVYDYYISCLEDTSRQGIQLLGEQGGYIETPEFVPGSNYRPFSSELDFFGQGIPYWMYVTGNNLLKEQVPTKTSMEEELGKYVGERIVDCDFSALEEAGFDVYSESGEVDVVVKEGVVSFDVVAPLAIYRGESSAIVDKHSFELNSKLGKFYGMALDIYDYEKSSAFLEEYGVDVMRLYAPVTGTEITCSPKVFVDEEIRADIVEGLTLNVPTIKLDGDYYELSSKERDYFVADAGFSVDENINFMYSSEWPTRIEMYGDRVAKPVGLQEGFGILGFCYVPYHFVYDINYPVLIQIYDNEELFQFPVSVIIEKNRPRDALPSITGEFVDSDVCEFKNQDVRVYTYDWNLNPVESRIQYKCLNSVCEIGETKTMGSDAILEGKFPSCVGGVVIASSEGYADSKAEIFPNEDSVANVILKKKYKMNLDLGSGVKQAWISFESEDYNAVALYPETKSIELVEGFYNVSVQIYDDSSLKFPAINDVKCVDVPKSGIAGFLGGETEECFDVNIPETNVDFAVIGGGKTTEFITEGQLIESNEINFVVPLFGLPNSIESLQQNFIKSEDETIYLSFE